MIVPNLLYQQGTRFHDFHKPEVHQNLPREKKKIEIVNSNSVGQSLQSSFFQRKNGNSYVEHATRLKTDYMMVLLTELKFCAKLLSKLFSRKTNTNLYGMATLFNASAYIYFLLVLLDTVSMI